MTKRQKQISNLIQEELSQVFVRDCSHLFEKSFVGVNFVTVTPDLKIANVYLSVFNGGDETIALVQENTRKIRQLLAQRIKNNVQFIPELRFFKDDLADYSDKMNKLIDSLNIKPKEDDQV